MIETCAFCMLATNVLKAKKVQHEVLNPLESWFSRYPIFRVYIIMYKSTGQFSTNVETIFRRAFHWTVGEGSGRRGFFPPVALASVVIQTLPTLYVSNLYYFRTEIDTHSQALPSLGSHTAPIWRYIQRTFNKFRARMIYICTGAGFTLRIYPKNHKE